MCASPISPSISALGTSAATESTTIRSIAPVRTSLSAISSACSPWSGCETSRSSMRDAELARVADVERVLGVDEGAHAARALRLGDRVQRQRRLARRLGAVDLDDAAARQAADAEREVEADRAGRDRRRSRRCRRPTSGMIAPLPNCFSMAAMAPATAFSLLLHAGHGSLLWLSVTVVGLIENAVLERLGEVGGRDRRRCRRGRRWCAPRGARG